MRDKLPRQRFNRPPSHPRSKGFTLVELIIVVVLLGIVSIGTFAYLGFGAQIFSDVVGRERLSSQSRFAIERLNRELRNALPASPRVFGSCLEFIPIDASSAYLEIPAPGNTDNEAIVIPPTDFDRNSALGSYLFIAANNSARVYGNNSSQRRIIDSAADDGGQWTLEFTESASFVRQSPARRYYISSGPVSWCVEGGDLVRYDTYPLSSDNPNRALGNRVLMGHGIMNPDGEAPFEVVPATLQRNNLVLIDLYFSRRDGLEPLILSHEVHLPNVP